MCNGCEDLEPTLSELNECSAIIWCDGESAESTGPQQWAKY